MRKTLSILLLFGTLIVSLALLMNSCSDKDGSVGSSLSPVKDRILVSADTFRLATFNVMVDYIYCNADSFLLGNYTDPVFGTTKADIFSQLACLEGYTFPDNAEVDSMELLLYYNDWYGHSNAVMDINVYEMDVATFDYSESYPSNINVSDYCTCTKLISQRTISAMHPTDSVYNTLTSKYSSVVVLRIGEDWMKYFFDIIRQHNIDQDDFNEYFKGLYITSQLGTSTMLYVDQLDMQVYYHYTYDKGDGNVQLYNDVKILPANHEVRTINRFEHPDQQSVYERLNEDTEYNYISSPSNLFTRIILPVDDIVEKISADIPQDKRVYLNGAVLRVDVMNTEDDSPANQMMLVKTEAIDRIFRLNEAATDTCAIVATLSSGFTANDSTFYYYAYDLSNLITHLYRTDEEYDLEYLDLTLIPVMVETPATGITAVKHLNTMSSTRIYSGSNSSKNLTLRLLYSGF